MYKTYIILCFTQFFTISIYQNTLLYHITLYHDILIYMCICIYTYHVKYFKILYTTRFHPRQSYPLSHRENTYDSNDDTYPYISGSSFKINSVNNTEKSGSDPPPGSGGSHCPRGPLYNNFASQQNSSNCLEGWLAFPERGKPRSYPVHENRPKAVARDDRELARERYLSIARHPHSSAPMERSNCSVSRPRLFSVFLFLFFFLR